MASLAVWLARPSDLRDGTGRCVARGNARTNLQGKGAEGVLTMAEQSAGGRPPVRIWREAGGSLAGAGYHFLDLLAPAT